MKRMMLTVMTLLAMCLASVAAHADTVTLSLTNPIQNVFPSGGTLTYEGTVFAPLSNTGDVFLNSDSYNVALPVTLDDSGFLFGFPFTLAPGETFTGTLFTLTIPAGAALGQYDGFFSIFGGANGAAQDPLATVTFAATVPEPSSILLAVAALAGLVRCSRPSVPLSRKS